MLWNKNDNDNILRFVFIIFIYIDGYFFNEVFIIIDIFVYWIYGLIIEKLNMFNLLKLCIVLFLFVIDYFY